MFTPIGFRWLAFIWIGSAILNIIFSFTTTFLFVSTSLATFFAIKDLIDSTVKRNTVVNRTWSIFYGVIFIGLGVVIPIFYFFISKRDLLDELSGQSKDWADFMTLLSLGVVFYTISEKNKKMNIVISDREIEDNSIKLTDRKEEVLELEQKRKI